ncbi:MAG: CDP-diacylglycerol--glycerol-3-phosphate 3-phosphatidyltransferase [Clostridiales bacterium]|nr:CDP-diacylglycerol--glycerol-3-phosphate 3-phosphatidyltransferase [Clostridiales bacterium]
MNLPNILTAIRFFMVPFFAYYLYVQQYKIAIIIFVLAGITDVLDGYIARKHKIVTEWGKLMDPLADKLMQLTALVMLTIHKIIPWVFLVIMLVKELTMVAGSIKLYKKDNVVVSANWYGKFATVMFYVAIVVTMLFKILGMDGIMSKVIVIILILLTLFAMIYAFIKYVFVYKEATKKKDI